MATTAECTKQNVIYVDTGGVFSASRILHFVNTESDSQVCIVELQWLRHGWLVYHGYFKLVLESLTKSNPIAADIIVFGIISG